MVVGNLIDLVPVLLTVQSNEEINDNIFDVDVKITHINTILNSVPDQWKSKENILLFEYLSILALKIDDLGDSKLCPHRINLIPWFSTS